MTAYDLDTLINRRDTDSVKWRANPADVLPMWVADMDFPSPQPVIDALMQRVQHGVFGYGIEPPELIEAIVERMQRLYGWAIAPQDVMLFPGVVYAANLTALAVAEPGDGILMQTPLYPYLLATPPTTGRVLQDMQLTRGEDGCYSIDFDRFEASMDETTRLFILCNPHNPVGRVFRRDELERMADICLRHNVMICSDEIHCDLIFSGNRHIPIASLSPEIARNTVTLMAPSKTYNIAGLKCSLAIVPNPELRKKLDAARMGLLGTVNILGHTAAHAAYTQGEEWLRQVLARLEANRDLLEARLRQLPGNITMSPMEGTYLAWLDCRSAGLPENPSKFFLEKARVAMNDGAAFGKGGDGFVRLNFGCPPAMLNEALDRMQSALKQLGG